MVKATGICPLYAQSTMHPSLFVPREHTHLAVVYVAVACNKWGRGKKEKERSCVLVNIETSFLVRSKEELPPFSNPAGVKYTSPPSLNVTQWMVTVRGQIGCSESESITSIGSPSPTLGRNTTSET